MSRKKPKGEPQYSRHHRIAKSRGGANGEPNNERIRHDVHRAVHMVFQNQHTLEKIATIISMDEAILKDHFKRIIMDIISVSPQDVFLIDAFANKHGFNSLKNERSIQ